MVIIILTIYCTQLIKIFKITIYYISLVILLMNSLNCNKVIKHVCGSDLQHKTFFVSGQRQPYFVPSRIAAQNGTVSEYTGSIFEVQDKYSIAIPISENLHKLSRLNQFLFKESPYIFKQYLKIKVYKRRCGEVSYVNLRNGRFVFFVVTKYDCEGIVKKHILTKVIKKLVNLCNYLKVTKLGMTRIGGRGNTNFMHSVLAQEVEESKLEVKIFHNN